jgi:MipA family protein
MMELRKFKAGCFLAILIMPAGNALADSSNGDGVTVGISGEYIPKYSGSDEHHWNIQPYLQARQGAFFIDSQKGIGYDLQSDNGLYFEHSFGYSWGRADHNSQWRDGADKLKGMGTIDGALDTQLAVGWQITNWLTPEIRAVLPLTDPQGGQYQASLTLLPWQDDTDTLAIQGGLLFGDGRYMKTWYGVSADQSQASGHPSYHTSGGFYGTQMDISWLHQFNRHWGTILGVNYDWLGDKAADSPIVSSRNNAGGVAVITWTF